MPEIKNKQSYYRPELDALRFFAFLCVFEHHYLYYAYSSLPKILKHVQQAGGFGVCLFFLLSAYLITSLLWKERAATQTVHLKAFYLRRILRIWPLYFAFLAFGFLLGRLKHAFAIEPSRMLAFLFLAGNWYAGVFGWTANPVSPLWSISIEEQFYLLMPSLARKAKAATLIGVSVAVILASYLTLGWLGIHQAAVTTAVWTNSLVQFQFFAAGCILATVLEGKLPVISNWLRAVMMAGGVALWILAARIGVESASGSLSAAALCSGYLLVLLGTLVIFLSFLGIKLAIPKFILYLGQISYGLYVFHLFVLLCVDSTRHYWDSSLAYSVRGVAGLLITILVASLSYEYFEKPFLRYKDRFTFVKSRSVTG